MATHSEFINAEQRRRGGLKITHNNCEQSESQGTRRMFRFHPPLHPCYGSVLCNPFFLSKKGINSLNFGFTTGTHTGEEQKDRVTSVTISTPEVLIQFLAYSCVCQQSLVCCKQRTKGSIQAVPARMTSEVILVQKVVCSAALCAAVTLRLGDLMVTWAQCC